MNKLNAFAAVLKFINGRNYGADSLKDICNYITDETKTNGGKLVATHGCSSEHPVDDMLTNKRLHNKTHGKQYEHFVLAPCPNGSDKSPEDILRATKEIVATAFPEYMAVMAVHTDSKFVHAHTVLDSVNAVSGRKRSQGPSDLNIIKQKTNNILEKHGFEIITASANEFVDHTDHSNEEGFDFLELDESQFIVKTDLEKIDSSTKGVSQINTYNPYFKLPRRDWYDINSIGGNDTMYNNNSFSPVPQQVQNSPVPVTETVPQNMPMNNGIQQPQGQYVPTAVEPIPATVGTVENTFPSTSVITGPAFNIKGTPDSNFAGLSELVEQTTAYAQEHQREAANLALAMQQYGQQTGYPSNVSVYAGPIFDIDLTGGMYPPLPEYDGNK